MKESKVVVSIPYTYVVGFSYLNLYYYGVRYAKGCYPNDLLKTYFTSSVLVHKLMEAGNKPDVVQIRNTFQSKDRAIKAERRALKVIKKAGKKNWININYGNEFGQPNESGYFYEKRTYFYTLLEAEKLIESSHQNNKYAFYCENESDLTTLNNLVKFSNKTDFIKLLSKTVPTSSLKYYKICYVVKNPKTDKRSIAERNEKIQKAYATGKYTQTTLGIKYGLSKQQVSRIIKGVV